MLAREYNESLRYSPSTGYLVYNGSFWEESDPLSQAVAQELTTRQLAEAETEINKRLKEMEQNGAFEILAQMGAKKQYLLSTNYRHTPMKCMRMH